MRKLIFGINVSIDGCCEHDKFGAGSDVHDYFMQLTRDAGVLLYGRKTYQLMVPFWPDIAKKPTGEKSLDDFAQAFVSVPQVVVVSRSLSKFQSANTAIVRGDLQNEILKLKQQPGKPIVVGGVDLPSQLMALELVDEIRLMVHPVIVGKGRRLFNETVLQENLGFQLADSQTFKSGCVALRYLK